MKDKLKYHGRIDNRVVILPPNMRSEMINYFDGCEIWVEIKEWKPRRSNRANAYYWAVIIPHVLEVLKDAGNGWIVIGNAEHQELAHRLMKSRFLEINKTLNVPDGPQVIVEPSTTDLDQDLFFEYCEKIRAWCLEFGNLHVPLPNEND